MAAEIGRAHSLGDCLESRLAHCAGSVVAALDVTEQRRARRIIAIGLATFFPSSDGAVPWAASAMTTVSFSGSSSSKATSSDSAPAIEPKRKHEVGQDVAVAIQRRNHERIARRDDQQGKVASISCGSYGTSGWRPAAASISSFSIPS